MGRSRRARPPWWGPLALVVAIGCEADRPLPQPADPARAREGLRAALDTWKDGEPPTALNSRTPPIRVADEDWLAGLRLESYQADDPGTLVGHSLHCPVVLSLKGGRGRAVRKKVVYSVDTDPALMVVRLESP